MTIRSDALCAAVAVTIAAGVVMAQPVGAASDRTDGATVTVTVKGLPKNAQFTIRPRVNLVGPTGTRSVDKWSVGRERTISGLSAGQYVVTGRSGTSKSGALWVPKSFTRWIKVNGSDTRGVIVRYVRSKQGDLPPNTWPVDMTDACRFDWKDPGARAATYNDTDPYAWYCVKSSGEKTTVDVGYYCKNHEARPRNAKLVYRRWHCTAW